MKLIMDVMLILQGNCLITSNALFMKSNAKTQFVTVSGGSIDLMRTIWSTATARDKTIAQITNFVTSIGFTGAELDWEAFGSWTATDFSNFKIYVKTLGAALQAKGKKLMISVPLITKDIAPRVALKLADFNVFPELDYIVVMAYDYMWDYGCGTPRAPNDWFQSGISWIQSQITDHSRIVIGVATDCYTCTTGQYDMRYTSFSDVKATQPRLATAARDVNGELNWVSGSSAYNCVDLKGAQSKVNLALSMGIQNVAAWYVGGGDQFVSVPKDPAPAPTNVVVATTTTTTLTASLGSTMTCVCTQTTTAQNCAATAPAATTTTTVTTTKTVVLATTTTTVLKTTTVSPTPAPSVAQGFVITNFAALDKNSLGNVQGDDGSLSKYAAGFNGGAIFSSTRGSYWYSVLGTTTTCFSTNANFIRIIGSGFIAAGGRLSVSLQTASGTTGCNRSGPSYTKLISTWTIDPATGFEVGEIQLSTMVGLNKAKIWAVVLTGILPAGTNFLIRSINLIT